MKKGIFLVLVLSIIGWVSVSACSAQRNKNAKKKAIIGTVKNIPVGSENFVIVPDDAPNQRFMPDQPLAPEFRKDGLKVRIKGAEGKIPDNVRMIGTPFTVRSIMKVE